MRTQVLFGSSVYVVVEDGCGSGGGGGGGSGPRRGASQFAVALLTRAPAMELLLERLRSVVSVFVQAQYADSILPSGGGGGGGGGGGSGGSGGGGGKRKNSRKRHGKSKRHKKRKKSKKGGSFSSGSSGSDSSSSESESDSDSDGYHPAKGAQRLEAKDEQTAVGQSTAALLHNARKKLKPLSKVNPEDVECAVSKVSHSMRGDERAALQKALASNGKVKVYGGETRARDSTIPPMALDAREAGVQSIAAYVGGAVDLAFATVFIDSATA